MTDKTTLEEIEAEVASLQCKPTDHSTHPSHMVYRLLEICREQVAEIASLRADLAQADAMLRSVP